jgi:hypothetical protein
MGCMRGYGILPQELDMQRCTCACATTPRRMKKSVFGLDCGRGSSPVVLESCPEAGRPITLDAQSSASIAAYIPSYFQHAIYPDSRRDHDQDAPQGPKVREKVEGGCIL